MKRTIRRTMTVIGLSMLVTVGAVTIPAGAAHAGGCNWYTPCGEVSNYSSWGMYDTLTLGSGPHYCDVWNWNGGSTPAWMHARCTQEYLGTGVHRGGGNIDVDAFTFNDRDYRLNFHGTWSWQTKGVWTKIKNNEGAYCYTDWYFGVPYCSVVYE